MPLQTPVKYLFGTLPESFRPVEPSRALHASERNLITFLLAEPFVGRDELRRQLESVRVVAEELPAGPTVILEVDPALPPTPPTAMTVPVDAEGVDRDGMPILVVLHAPDGYLYELEIVRFDGEPPLAMPQTDTLTRTINDLPPHLG